MEKLNNRVGLLIIFSGILLIVVSAISNFAILYLIMGVYNVNHKFVVVIISTISVISGIISLPMFVFGIILLLTGSRMFGSNDILFLIRKESTTVVATYMLLFVVFVLATVWGIAYSTCDVSIQSRYLNGIIFSGIISASSLAFGIMLRINFWRLEKVAFESAE